MSRSFLQIASVSLLLLAAIQLPSYAATEQAAQSKSKHSSYRHSRGNSFLVPPPPPTAVSPTVLAAYPANMHNGTSYKLSPAKPRHLAEQMKLTAVMDEVAFFKISGDESVHLQKGSCFQTVTVASVSPNEVILEEKGLQFVKHLR